MGVQTNMFIDLQYFFTDSSKDPFCYLCFVFVILAVLSVPCLERDDLLALLYVVFLCFCHIPIWCPGSEWAFDCFDS